MKIKRLSAVMAVVMAFGNICADAYNSSYLDGNFVNVSSVEFKTAEGEIDTLPQTGEVIISAKAKKGKMADDVQQVSLVAALYSNEDLISVSTQSYELTDNYTKPLEIRVDVTGATGLRAFVCNNLDDGVPFAARSILSGEGAEVLAITVGGKELDDFSPEKTEYSVTVPAGYVSFPEIMPRLTDSGIKCEIETTGSFPLDAREAAVAVIRIGENTEYKINITQEQPEITNLVVVDEVKASGDVIDETAGIVKGIKDVTFAVEPTEPVKVSTDSATGEDMTVGYGYGNITSSTPMHSDRIYPIIFVPEILKNALLIHTKLSFERRAGSRIDFDINHPATVYATVRNGNSAELVAAGYELVNSTNFSYLSCDAEKGRIYQYLLYKKHFDVVPGELTSVEVPHGAANAFVVFDGSVPVTNARLKSRNGQEMNLPAIEVRNAEYRNPKDPAYREGIENYSYAAKFISDKQNESYRFSTDFPEELIGTIGIAVPDNPRNYENRTSQKQFISFDLTESAEVYIAYEAEMESMPWMVELGYEDVSSIGSIKYVHSNELSENTTKLYKKAYTVVPGETVRVDIGGFPNKNRNENDEQAKSPLMIFVKKSEG